MLVHLQQGDGSESGGGSAVAFGQHLPAVHRQQGVSVCGSGHSEKITGIVFTGCEFGNGGRFAAAVFYNFITPP